MPLRSNGLSGSWGVKAKWLNIWLSITLLLAGLTVLVINISKSWPFVVSPNYIDAGDFTNLTRVLPLPYEIDQIAHKSIFDYLHDLERLRSLTHSQFSLSLSVKATNRELAKLLVCALKRDPCGDSHDKNARLALLSKVILVRKQVQFSVSNVSGLHELYTSIKPAYQTYKLAVAKALETTQLDDHEELLVSAQPLFSQWWGIDYKKRYWDPWIKKKDELDDERSKIQSGMAALEKELGRLEKIAQVAQEVDDNLEHFITFILNDTKVMCNACNILQRGYALMKFSREQQLDGGQSGEKAQKDWFQQHFARYHLQDEEPLTNSHFDAWWSNLDCWHYA